MSLKLVSWNVRGLHSPIKRQRVLSHLARLGADIACIQESHLTAEESAKLGRGWVGEVFFSPGDGKRNGVLILCRKSLPLKLVSQSADGAGRWVCVKLLLDNVPISLLNIYAPTVEDPSFWTSLSQQIAGHYDANFVLMGDCNQIMDPFLDRNSSTPFVSHKSHKFFTRMIKQYRLIDAWRLCNPTLREYTFYSPMHGTQSRLDYFFVSHNVSQSLIAADIGSILISDHAPTTIQLDILQKPSTSRKWRFNNALLLDPVFVSSFASFIQEYFETNQSDSLPFHIVWGAFKASARDFIINFTSKKRREARERTQILLANIKRLEHSYYSSKSSSNLSALIDAKFQFNKITTNNASNFLLKSSAKYYGGQNKAGKLLANYLKVRQNKLTIESVLDSSNVLKHKDGEILQEFFEFYKNLYTSEAPSFDHTITQFLSSTPRAQSDNPDLSTLELDLTQKELLDALRTLKKEKAPGPDGFTVEFYTHFHKLLLPKLHALVLEFLTSGISSDSFSDAYICLIPKDGKDPQHCKNYRPISLVNVDYKIFSKALALRMDNYLPGLLGKEQSGFVKGRLLTDNTRLFFNVLSKASHASYPLAAIALDAEKAFDRVEWPYMFQTLKWFGFGPKIVSMISLLYFRPRAAICANGDVSAYFPLGRGVRQGCPLSPFLFNLALEPFLLRLRQNENIHGFRFKESHIKMAAYADDVLLFISQPQSSIPAFLQEVDSFSHVSGYKLNKDKCEILPLTKFSFKADFSASGFKWSSQSIKYLGLQFTPSISGTISRCMEECTQRLSTLTTKWHPLYLSWWGRLDTIKMMLSPIILYTLSNIPLSIPAKYFKKFNSILSSFLWGKKKARMSIANLSRPKVEGGVNFPDFLTYHKAFLLRQASQWLSTSLPKCPLWTSLENSFISPFTFQEYVLFSRVPKSISTPILKHTSKILPVSPSSLLTDRVAFRASPIWHNNSIQIQGKPLYWKAWRARGLTWVYQLYEQDRLISFTQARVLFDLPSSFQSKYLLLTQAISEALTKISEPAPIQAPVTPSYEKIHALLLKGSRASILYNALRTPGVGREKSRIELSWEKDLSVSWSIEFWDKIWLKLRKSSRAASTIQTLFFIYHRLLFTPLVLSIRYTNLEDKCWTCASPHADLIHMLFKCKFTLQFWNQVWTQINIIFDSHHPFSEVHLFLGSLAPQWQSIGPKAKIIDLLIAVAFQQITRNWKDCTKLSYQAWWYAVCHNHRLDTTFVYPLHVAPQRLQLWSPITSFLDISASRSRSTILSPMQQEASKPP